MLRRPISLILLVCALAGCGVESETGNESKPVATASEVGNASKPEASGSEGAAPAAAAAGAPDEARLLADYREASLSGCIGGARDAAPPGTPVERHCGCAVDRVMAGKSHAELEAEELSGAYAPRFQEAMRACIREIGG